MRFLAAICLLLSTLPGMSQLSIGLKVSGLAFHPKPSPHPSLYADKKDAKGQWVHIGGLMFTAEWEMIPGRAAVAVAQGLLLDCSNQWAGYSHIGVRGIIRQGRHTVSAGIGPSWFYRKSWAALPGYVDEGLFRKKGGRQTSFYWYGGYASYDLALDERQSFTANLIPGWPEVFLFSAGMKQKVGSWPESAVFGNKD
jgi:hypothetical protein